MANGIPRRRFVNPDELRMFRDEMAAEQANVNQEEQVNRRLFI